MSENGNVRQKLFWRMQSSRHTVIMNIAPNFLGNNLQLGSYANSAALRTTLLQWCYYSRKCGANPTVSAGNGTGADDDSRMQVDPPQETQGEGHRRTPKPERKSHEQHKQHEQHERTSTRARPVAELDIGRKTAGDEVEVPTTIPPVTTATQNEGKNEE